MVDPNHANISSREAGSPCPRKVRGIRLVYKIDVWYFSVNSISPNIKGPAEVKDIFSNVSKSFHWGAPPPRPPL